MIWVNGAILPDDGLAIPASDRTFDHGLGLFETLRTWRGRAPLLERHRARMLRSAGTLGIPIEPGHFPDEDAVRALLGAEADRADRLLRITATGGSPGQGATVWMRSKPLGEPRASVRVALGGWAVRSDDPLARHKSLNFWSRRRAFEAATARGFDETLVLTGHKVYGEGGWSNLFWVRHGELWTASLDAPIVPGVMRGLVLEHARGLLMVRTIVQGFDRRMLAMAHELFLTSSVRGIVPISELEGVANWDAPGPWTARLQASVAAQLAEGRA